MLVVVAAMVSTITSWLIKGLLFGQSVEGGLSTPKSLRCVQQGFRPASGSERGWAENVTRPAEYTVGVG
jgi:hypothetical protein